MASQVHRKGATAPEMNITPLIDVVFQLIIFFMLVNNIVAEQLVQMVVPTLEEPKTYELQGENKITVNVAPRDYTEQRENPLAFDGRAQEVRIFGERFDVDDVEGIAALLREVLERRPDAEVLLRADAALYYEDVQPAMAAIAEAGILTVNLVAYMPEKGPVANSRPANPAAD